MRYIAVFLILLNLAYLGWNLARPPVGPVQTEAPRPLLNTGLTLLNEYQADAAEQARLNALAERQCTLVSGFASLDGAALFMDEARGMGLEAALQLGGEPLPSQYRVYLPSASSRSIATITLDGLGERLAQTDLGIESYLITRGPLENAVALGVFADQDSARAVQEQVRGLGYEPRIEEIPRSTGGIEVWLRAPSSQRVEDAEWLDLTAERPALTRSENLCQTLVQAPQFQ